MLPITRFLRKSTTPEPWARKLRDERHIGDFTRWKDHDAYRKSFERLMRDLTVQQAPEAS